MQGREDIKRRKKRGEKIGRSSVEGGSGSIITEGTSGKNLQG